MKIATKKAMVLIVIIGIFTLFVIGSVVCAKPIGVTISPSKIKLELEIGSTGNSFISVINSNDFSINVKSEIEDFVPGDLPGDIQFIPKSEGVSSLVDWIEINLESFSLEPKEIKKVPIKISVPENASPGGHFAVAFFTPKLKVKEETTLQVSGRVGTLIYVTVPGDIIQTGEMINFTTSNFIRKGPIKFAVLFKNIGTSYYEPQGTIKISNIFNKEISILEVPNRVVLPQGSRSIETNWNVKYLFGKYVAKISLTDGEGKIHTAVTSFWVFPWLEILLIIIGVVLLFALFRLAKKKLKFRNPFVLKE